MGVDLDGTGGTTATKAFAGEGEKKKQEVETQASGGNEQVGGGAAHGEGGGLGGGGGGSNDEHVGGEAGDAGDQNDEANAEANAEIEAKANKAAAIEAPGGGATGDVTEADIKLGKNTLVGHDDKPTPPEEKSEREPIDPDIVDEAMKTALDCQCPLDVNTSPLDFEPGDRVHIRSKTNIITVDVIAMNPEGDECVGKNETSSEWLVSFAHLPYGCYVRFVRENVVRVV